MQRRRKPKAAPANVFSGGQKPKKTKKPTQAPVPVKQRQIPTSKATPPVRVGTPKTISENKEDDASIETEKIEVVESQILGVPRRKSSGLKVEDSSLESDEEEKTADETAIDIEVQEALARAKERSEAAKIPPKRAPAPLPSTKPKRKKTGRGRNKTYQPAAREKRLDRARHMEYKYEMKGLLQELSVAEEHRSSIIGSVWAKGERQTAEEAKTFVESKVKEGAIDDDQAARLIGLIDNYTVRR
ncbi:MAG: hypothetical protein CMB75_04475 [Euryarchaeota archaeon]|nr:hypothetical protein [Euryarchaeota archaeon]